MTKLLKLTVLIFLLSCASQSEKDDDKSSKSVYPEAFLQMKNNAIASTPKVFDVKIIGVNQLVSSEKIVTVDRDYYNKYLSEYIQLDDGIDNLYYYSVNEDGILCSTVIKVSKLNTTIYTAYLVVFNDNGVIENVVDISLYESYPGGEITMRSMFLEDNEILQITLNSFVDYDGMSKKEVITTDSISITLKIKNSDIVLVKADTTRYSK